MGIVIDENKYEIALKRMSFDYMKANETLFNPLSVRWKIPNQFIRNGMVGDHQALFHQNRRYKCSEMEEGNGQISEGSITSSLSYYDLFNMMIQESLSQYSQTESETEKTLIKS